MPEITWTGEARFLKERRKGALPLLQYPGYLQLTSPAGQKVKIMSRRQALTLASLGIKWRLVAPGKFRIFLGGREATVSSYDEALSVAANFWGSL